MEISDYGSTIKPGCDKEACKLPSVQACLAWDPQSPWALISEVLVDSPAWDVGLEAGMVICSVNGIALRDMIDWIWESGGYELELFGFDSVGDSFNVTLEREAGEDWGLTFSDCIFDGLLTCCNACSFCFMHQLPKGLRESLYLRDDDYRLSFLQGNFVTLTNISDEDLQRILSLRISPLHVSLHAVDEEARRSLMGPRAMRGLEVLDSYLSSGLEAHIQLVLCPGINDGQILRETLDYCLRWPGVLSVGLVPLGYTKYQSRFVASYEDSRKAQEIIALADEYNQLSQKRHGKNRIFPSDEFYLNAYPCYENLQARLPSASWYEGFPQFQDGIGFVRCFIDELNQNLDLIQAIKQLAFDSAKDKPLLVCGEAFEKFALPEFERLGLTSVLDCMVVPNSFFGGNVDVLGLLCAEDIIAAWKERGAPSAALLLPRVMFNSDMLTLDGMSATDLSASLGGDCSVVSFEATDILNVLKDYYVTS